MVNYLSPTAILGPYRKYATTKNLLIGAGLALAAYLGYNYITKQNNNKKGKGGTTAKGRHPAVMGAAPGEITNPRLEFTVFPPTMRPNVPGTIEIKGIFKGDDNFPAETSEGFFAIYDAQDNIITTGSLGKNITQFAKTVQLPPLKNGAFTVEVSDAPIEVDDGMGAS